MKIISIFTLIIALFLSACTHTTQNGDIQENTNTVVQEALDQDEQITPPISAFPDQAFRALGTEPFWSFTYDNQNLEWSEIGEEDIIEESHFVQQVYLESDNTYYITGDFIAIQIFEETCSDGMSDDMFDYRVTGNYFDMELNGCAETL